MRTTIILDTRRVKKSADAPCRGCVGEFSPPLCAHIGTPEECADRIFIVTDAGNAKPAPASAPASKRGS